MSQQVNLFNPVFLKQKKYFSSIAMLQALGVVGLACSLLAVDATRRTASLEKQAAATGNQLEAKQADLAKMAQFAPRQKNKALESEMAQALIELKSMQDVSAIVRRGEFGDTRGFSEYFRAFARQGVGGLWLTDLSIGAAGQIGVKGKALQADLVPNYIRRLARETVMQGKSFATLEISVPAVPASYVQFSLQSEAAKPAELSGTQKK